MRPQTLVGLVAQALLGPLALPAQEVTGSARGRAIAEDSTPLAAVRITVTGPNLLGSRSVESDARGDFVLLALPPGVYELRTAHVGYRPIVMTNVVVALARTTNLGTLTLQPATLQLEALVVEGAPVVLDAAGTTSGGTLDASDYAALPVDRDFKSLITILPQVNQSYRGDAANVGGSTGLENQYYIDGVNVSDTRTGSRATSLPWNFVRAVDVKTGSYEARYGRALGALVNADTYSGTNDFEGNAFAFVQPGALALDARPLPGVTSASPLSYDVGVRASGPVRKDRLWFSAAVNPRIDEVSQDVVEFGAYTDRTTALRFAGKLTWRASSTVNVEATVFGDPSTRDAVEATLPGGITTVSNPDALLARVTSGGTVASLRGFIAPSRSLLIEASLARQWDHYSNEGLTEVARSEERYLDFVTGSIGGGLGFVQEEDRGRTTLAAVGTFSLARHTIVGGVEYEDAGVTSSFKVTGLGFITRTADGFLVDSQAYAGTFHNRSPAVFLQDAWRVADRLTLNLGLRWSGQYMTGASGNVAQAIPDEWQPRLGFIWQLGAARSQRLFGSYGRFHQMLTTNIAVLWFVDYPCKFSQFTSDPREPGAVPTSVTDCSTLEADYAQQIPGLEAENFDEFTLGYERLLGRHAKLTLRGTRRRLRSSFQWGLNLDADPVWAFGTPGQGTFDFLPPPKREYAGLEVSAEGVWRGLRYRGSYVLSRTWGNYSGLYSSDAGFANPGLNGGFWMPHQATNSTGDLPTDRRHIVKLSGAYPTGFGLTIGGFLSFESGSPINEFGAGPNTGPLSPSFLVPRGTAGRTPSLWNLDLRLSYDLPLRGTFGARVQADLLHFGNPQGTTRVDEVLYTAVDENGSPSNPNARYREPTGYQPPMAARLGMELNF